MEEYILFIFTYPKWDLILATIGAGILALAWIGRIIRNRNILSKKEIYMALLTISCWIGVYTIVFVGVIKIIDIDFLSILLVILQGMGIICCGYLLKYQEEFAKEGRKKVFKYDLAPKELFIIGGIIVCIGLMIGICAYC